MRVVNCEVGCRHFSINFASPNAPLPYSGGVFRVDCVGRLRRQRLDAGQHPLRINRRWATEYALFFPKLEWYPVRYSQFVLAVQLDPTVPKRTPPLSHYVYCHFKRCSRCASASLTELPRSWAKHSTVLAKTFTIRASQKSYTG